MTSTFWNRFGLPNDDQSQTNRVSVAPRRRALSWNINQDYPFHELYGMLAIATGTRNELIQDQPFLFPPRDPGPYMI
jgi:hypothetical protein